MSSQDWIERIYAELTRDTTAATPDPDAQMTAAALMGIIDAACGMWVAGEGNLSDLLNSGLDLIDTTLLTRFDTTKTST